VRDKLELRLRIVAIAVCICFAQGVHYSQTSPEVVRFRSRLEIKNPRRVLFSPVSKLLAVQHEAGVVRIIDVADGREQSVLPLSDKAAYSMQWTTDGLRLLLVNSNSATLWDARRGTVVSTPIEVKRDKAFRGFDRVKLSPDEKSLLSVRERESFKAALIEKDNARAQVWSLESGKMRFEVKINGLEGRAQFSPDSKLLLTTSSTDDAKLWDVETGAMVAALKPPERMVLCGGTNAQFSPDARLVVVHRNNCGTWIWDTATRALRAMVPVDKDDVASLLKGFTPDGKMFAVAQQRLKGWSIRTSIDLRDCETGELRATLTDSKWEDWPQYVLWSNDGRTFVATSGHKYKGRIWDVSTGALKATIPMLLTYSRNPLDFGFKDRDELSIHPTLPLISAASNKFVRLWNADTGELMQTLENTGGTSAWSADGKLLLISPEDRTSVSVWDVVGPTAATRARVVHAASID